jgi:hypothetical protein
MHVTWVWVSYRYLSILMGPVLAWYLLYYFYTHQYWPCGTSEIYRPILEAAQHALLPGGTVGRHQPVTGPIQGTGQ